MLRDRELRLLTLARLTSAAGGEATFFIGIWGRAAFEMRATPHELALVMTVMGVAGLVGSMVSGALVDRYGPKRLVIAGELLVAPATLMLMVPTTLPQLAATVALVGFAAMVAFNAIVSFPRVLTADPDRLGRANAALEVAFTAAFVIGPAGGAALSTLVGLDALFVADAAASLVAVALCTRLPRPTAATAVRAPLRWCDLTAGLRFAYSRPRLRLVFGVGALLWLSIGFFGALEPLYFRETLHVGAATLGWVNSVFGLGMAAGAAVLGAAPRRFATLPAIAALAAAGGVGSIIYAGTATLAVVIVGALLWGVVLGLLSPTVRTLAQAETPEHMAGRAMGALQLHERAGDLTPLVIAPVLASAVGAQGVLVASGALVVVVALALLPAARHLERAVRAPVSVPAVPDVREATPCSGQLAAQA